MNSRFGLRTALWIFCGFALAGCDKTVELRVKTLQQFWFSEKVASDLLPLSAADRSFDIRDRISDGASGASKVITPVLPPGIPADGTFPVAHTYWITAGAFRLTYEAVIFGLRMEGLSWSVTPNSFSLTRAVDEFKVSNPLQPGRKRMTLNRWGVMTPGDPFNGALGDRRVVVALRGNDSFVLLQQHPDLRGGLQFDLTPLTVALERCTQPDSDINPMALPALVRRGCARESLRDLCRSGTGTDGSFTPWTVLKCGVAVERDTSYSLHVVGPISLSTAYDAGSLFPNARPQGPTPGLPTLRVVPQNRQRIIVRRMKFVERTCSARGATGDEEDCSAAHIAALDLWRKCRGHVIKSSDPSINEYPFDLQQCPVNLAFPGVRGDLDYTRIQSVWRFQLTRGGDGVYPEMFAPDVQVNFARVFLRKADGTRQYVTAADIRPLRLTHPFYQRPVECPALNNHAPASSVFSISDCARIAGSPPTPAFPHATAVFDKTLAWTVAFQVDAVASGQFRLLERPGTFTTVTGTHYIDRYFPVLRTAELFIEIGIEKRRTP